MKAVLFLFLLGVCSASANRGIKHKKFDILAALHGHKKHSPAAADPTGILSNIMQRTQLGLAQAEKHHDEAVKAARDQIESLLTKAGGRLSLAMQQYNNTLAGTASALEATKNAATRTMELAEKTSTSSSWNSAASEEIAQVSAQISFVESALRKEARESNNGLRMATSQAEMLLSESDVQKLSRKVGDLTELVQKVHDSTLVPHAAVPSASAAVVFAQKGGDASALKSVHAELLAAEKQAAASRKAAEKVLNAAFDSVELDLSSGAKVIDASLVAAQKVEIGKVDGAVSSVEPPKKALRRKKHTMI